MGLDVIAGSIVAPVYAHMLGEPVTGNTGPNSMDGEYEFPHGKEFCVQE